MLAYFRAISIVLFGSVYYRQLAYDVLGLFASRILPVVMLIALVGGGLGIANEKNGASDWLLQQRYIQSSRPCGSQFVMTPSYLAFYCDSCSTWS